MALDVFSSSTCAVSIPAYRRRAARPSRTGADLKCLLSLTCPQPTLIPTWLLNTRSAKKALLILHFIVGIKFDLLCLTETWDKQNDGILFKPTHPSGLRFLFDLPLLSSKGGGKIIYSSYTLSPVNVPSFSLFECLALKVCVPHPSVIATVCTHKCCRDFLDDFQCLLVLKFWGSANKLNNWTVSNTGLG